MSILRALALLFLFTGCATQFYQSRRGALADKSVKYYSVLEIEHPDAKTGKPIYIVALKNHPPPVALKQSSSSGGGVNTNGISEQYFHITDNNGEKITIVNIECDTNKNDLLFNGHQVSLDAGNCVIFDYQTGKVIKQLDYQEIIKLDKENFDKIVTDLISTSL